MGIHSPDPYQCHVVAVMLCQIRVIRFRLQPDPIYRLFGDRLYDFAVFDGIKRYTVAVPPQSPMYFV